jgi:hypothetical protein
MGNTLVVHVVFLGTVSQLRCGRIILTGKFINMTFREALIAIKSKFAVDTHRNGKVLIMSEEWNAIEDELEKRGASLIRLRREMRELNEALKGYK